MRARQWSSEWWVFLIIDHLTAGQAEQARFPRRRVLVFVPRSVDSSLRLRPSMARLPLACAACGAAAAPKARQWEHSAWATESELSAV